MLANPQTQNCILNYRQNNLQETNIVHIPVQCGKHFRKSKQIKAVLYWSLSLWITAERCYERKSVFAFGFILCSGKIEIECCISKKQATALYFMWSGWRAIRDPCFESPQSCVIVFRSVLNALFHFCTCMRWIELQLPFMLKSHCFNLHIFSV